MMYEVTVCLGADHRLVFSGFPPLVAILLGVKWFQCGGGSDFLREGKGGEGRGQRENLQ